MHHCEPYTRYKGRESKDERKGKETHSHDLISSLFTPPGVALHRIRCDCNHWIHSCRGAFSIRLATSSASKPLAKWTLPKPRRRNPRPRSLQCKRPSTSSRGPRCQTPWICWRCWGRSPCNPWSNGRCSSRICICGPSWALGAKQTPESQKLYQLTSFPSFRSPLPMSCHYIYGWIHTYMALFCFHFQCNPSKIAYQKQVFICFTRKSKEFFPCSAKNVFCELTHEDT